MPPRLDLDGHGRLLLPPELREFALLERTGC
jgi:DNA-binding transcriptional regulator/RsmH inhibitor MraZ